MAASVHFTIVLALMLPLHQFLKWEGIHVGSKAEPRGIPGSNRGHQPGFCNGPRVPDSERVQLRSDELTRLVLVKGQFRILVDSPSYCFHPIEKVGRLSPIPKAVESASPSPIPDVSPFERMPKSCTALRVTMSGSIARLNLYPEGGALSPSSAIFFSPFFLC